VEYLGYVVSRDGISASPSKIQAVQKSRTLICVVVLQNCMGCVEGETCSCSATCDADGTEDNIKIEEAMDTRSEIPEAISFPVLEGAPHFRPKVVLMSLSSYILR
jgi:hypothetical protein